MEVKLIKRVTGKRTPCRTCPMWGGEHVRATYTQTGYHVCPLPGVTNTELAQGQASDQHVTQLDGLCRHLRIALNGCPSKSLDAASQYWNCWSKRRAQRHNAKWVIGWALHPMFLRKSRLWLNQPQRAWGTCYSLPPGWNLHANLRAAATESSVIGGLKPISAVMMPAAKSTSRGRKWKQPLCSTYRGLFLNTASAPMRLRCGLAHVGRSALQPTFPWVTFGKKRFLERRGWSWESTAQIPMEQN